MHGSCGAKNDRGEFFKTKKSLKDAAKNGERIVIEIYTVFNERTIEDAATENGTYFVAGPHPERDRRWYAEIIVKNGKVEVK